jgi:hypothetical protein
MIDKFDQFASFPSNSSSLSLAEQTVIKTLRSSFTFHMQRCIFFTEGHKKISIFVSCQNAAAAHVSTFYTFRTSHLIHDDDEESEEKSLLPISPFLLHYIIIASLHGPVRSSPPLLLRALAIYNMGKVFFKS